MSEAVFQKITALLDEHNISYQVLDHKPTPTSEDAARIRGTTAEQGAKAMVLRSSGEFIMFVLSGVDKIDLKKAKEVADVKRISFASPDQVLEVMDCVVGSVPPFGNLMNLRLFVDKNLLRNEKIAFNAGLLGRSILMDTLDYLKVTKAEKEHFVL